MRKEKNSKAATTKTPAKAPEAPMPALSPSSRPFGRAAVVAYDDEVVVKHGNVELDWNVAENEYLVLIRDVAGGLLV